jgi:hypothetical protein
MALIYIQANAIGHKEMREVFTHTQEVRMPLAQYSQPIGEVQIVYDHPQ